MSTEFRNVSGDLVCIRWFAGMERGACLDFGTEENFNFYHNDERAARMPVFGSDGSKTTVFYLVFDTTGTRFVPNPRITFGEFTGTTELT